jgi:uncharacterized membrane protein
MTAPDPVRRRRIASIALVASLALNGFLAGALATGALRGHHHRDAGPRVFAFELRRLAEHLPREEIDRIAESLRPLEPEMRAQLDEIRAKRQAVNRLAAVPEPDRAAIDAALADVRREAEAMRAEVHRATFDAVLALPPESRARLAEPPKRP